MANTKKLTPAERKQSKRNSRKELKKLGAGLTSKQRKAFRKEPKGIKTFLAEQEKKQDE